MSTHSFSKILVRLAAVMLALSSAIAVERFFLRAESYEMIDHMAKVSQKMLSDYKQIKEEQAKEQSPEITAEGFIKSSAVHTNPLPSPDVSPVERYKAIHNQVLAGVIVFGLLIALLLLSSSNLIARMLSTRLPTEVEILTATRVLLRFSGGYACLMALLGAIAVPMGAAISKTSHLSADEFWALAIFFAAGCVIILLSRRLARLVAWRITD